MSGEAVPAPRGSGEVEIMALGSGKVEPAHLGVGWSFSRALDYSDESMLMVISSSSSDTPVLVPDSSPRAYRAVEYSFGGFSERENSKGLGLLLLPTA